MLKASSGMRVRLSISPQKRSFRVGTLMFFDILAIMFIDKLSVKIGEIRSPADGVKGIFVW